MVIYKKKNPEKLGLCESGRREPLVFLALKNGIKRLDVYDYEKAANNSGFVKGGIYKNNTYNDGLAEEFTDLNRGFWGKTNYIYIIAYYCNYNN